MAHLPMVSLGLFEKWLIADAERKNLFSER